MKGSVVPAITNVRILVYTPDEHAPNGQRLVAESTTDASGSYSIGPLPDDASYVIVRS